MVYLCKALICSNSINLDILAFLDEPQVGIIGLIVVHVERLQNKHSVHHVANRSNGIYQTKLNRQRKSIYREM